PRDLGQRQGVEKRGKAGQYQPDINLERGKRRRQCRDDIAEPAGLDPGKQLGRGMEDAHRLSARVSNSLSALQGGEGGDPPRSGGEGEVGVGRRSGIPHLTLTLSAPRGGEGGNRQRRALS